MEAISHAGTAVGILSSEGVVLAAEKKITSKLLEPSKSSEKMYMVDEHVACAVAGITADANILINYARQAAQRYQLTYQEPMPVEQLVQALCDTKQGYTQYGGLRPFGVSVLYAGWDKQHGFQLYCSGRPRAAACAVARAACPRAAPAAERRGARRLGRAPPGARAAWSEHAAEARARHLARLSSASAPPLVRLLRPSHAAACRGAAVQIRAATMADGSQRRLARRHKPRSPS